MNVRLFSVLNVIIIYIFTACVFGEKVFVNNQSWSPVIPPFGKMKCFICQCFV